MPSLSLRDFSCFYRLDGVQGRPVVMLAHALGLDQRMWEPQAAGLLPDFRVLRYDIRGHGASSATSGDYSIGQLGQDAIDLLDALDLQQVAFCGLSLGGMIGQWIASHQPDRLTRLVLANTSPKVAQPSAMEERRRTVLDRGMHAVVEATLDRFFGADVAAADTAAVHDVRRTLLATDPVGYAGACAAVRDMDQTTSLSAIRTPTLIVSGDRDASMPWDRHGAILEHGIASAIAVRLPAAHLSNLAMPHTFTGLLRDFVLMP